MDFSEVLSSEFDVECAVHQVCGSINGSKNRTDKIDRAVNGTIESMQTITENVRNLEVQSNIF